MRALAYRSILVAGFAAATATAAPANQVMLHGWHVDTVRCAMYRYKAGQLVLVSVAANGRATISAYDAGWHVDPTRRHQVRLRYNDQLLAFQAAGVKARNGSTGFSGSVDHGALAGLATAEGAKASLDGIELGVIGFDGAIEAVHAIEKCTSKHGARSVPVGLSGLER
jgi:hypothetical protein